MVWRGFTNYLQQTFTLECPFYCFIINNNSKVSLLLFENNINLPVFLQSCRVLVSPPSTEHHIAYFCLLLFNDCFRQFLAIWVSNSHSTWKYFKHKDYFCLFPLFIFFLKGTPKGYIILGFRKELMVKLICTKEKEPWFILTVSNSFLY